MKNISFDNPYLLLIAIPLLLLVYIPFFITRNKDNRSALWTVSLILHTVIVAIISLAAAGLGTKTVMTKTTVYVLADVSYSSDRNLDVIDGYVMDIKNSLPANSDMGIVCFGKDCIVVTPAGRTVKSVSEAEVDNSATDIVGALNYTETLFKGDTLKRIVLITDGNDTVNRNSSDLAATVSRLTENGVKIDAIYLDNSLKEGEKEVQLVDVDHSVSTYIGHSNEAKFLIRASEGISLKLELYRRELAEGGAPKGDFKLFDSKIINAESGFTTASISLLTDREGTFEYRATIVTDTDISSYNNTLTSTQTVASKTKILLVSASRGDGELLKSVYGSSSEIDTRLIPFDTVPITVEELVVYDEIVISDLDVRDIKNVNAFIDSLDIVVSQYGKSLITLGDIRVQTNSEDRIFEKFSELLPLSYGNTGVDGRLYTIVLDVSHSMFMASKFTIAKDSAIKLLSILDDEDYVSLVTFSGEIKVKTPKKVRECKQELIAYIDSLKTDHGTDIGMGLEEALKTVKALNLTENQIMLISDGFSFNSERDAVEVAGELYLAGATVSAINTYIMADGENGRNTMKNIVNAGEGGKYYEISSPERVESVVFGDMANDVSDVIIEKDSAVKIEKYKDGIVNGILSLPKVSGYVLSIPKYDATVPLTVTYVKANGYQETVPLYAYRSHGNGRIAAFAGNLFDGWTKHWSTEDKSRFIENLFVSNTPSERIDRPFSVKTEIDNSEAYVEIVPSYLDPSAVTTLKITYPSAKTVTRTLTFDSTKYFYTFKADSVGTYRMEIVYSYDNKSYIAETSFEIPYLLEYDAFVSFDKYNVSEFMRDNGSVCVDSIPSLENDKSEITMYKQSFKIPLLISAVALFIIDVLIRKLRISKKMTSARAERK